VARQSDTQTFCRYANSETDCKETCEGQTTGGSAIGNIAGANSQESKVLSQYLPSFPY
jgi:hypothetical protein